MSLAGISLRDLEYVVAVSETLHFGKAAERCGVSQSALSAQVKKTEGLLGAEIFERTNKKVFLTPKGEVLIAQARRVLVEANRLFSLSQSWADPMSGRLRLGAIETLGPYYFPKILAPLREAYSSLQPSLTEGRTADLIRQLHAGEIDAALLSPPFDQEGLVAEPLFFEPFMLMLPTNHPLATAPEARIDSILAEGLVVLEDGHCLSDQTLELCEQIGKTPSRQHATGIETLRYIVAIQNGFSIVPALAAEEGSTLGGLLCYRAFDQTPPGRTISLVWRASAADRREFRILANFLRKTAPAAVARERPSQIASEPA